MLLHGSVNEITDLLGFLPGWITSHKPTAGTTKPLAGARVEVSVDIAPGVSFLPAMSVHADTDPSGHFTVNLADGFAAFKNARLVVFRTVSTIKVPFVPKPIPILEPVYRSATFDPTALGKKASLDVFTSIQQGDTAHGITQAQVDAQVSAAKSSIGNVSTLNATITDGGVAVHGEGQGATINFDIGLRPDTSADLNAFIADSVDNIDIDLPGPDFLTGLCVSKDDIAKHVRSGVQDLVDNVNKQIFDALVTAVAAKTGQPKSTVKAFLKTEATTTVHALRTPVVDHVKIGGFLDLPVRSIVLDPCFGVPRTF